MLKDKLDRMFRKSSLSESVIDSILEELDEPVRAEDISGGAKADTTLTVVTDKAAASEPTKVEEFQAKRDEDKYGDKDSVTEPAKLIDASVPQTDKIHMVSEDSLPTEPAVTPAVVNAAAYPSASVVGSTSVTPPAEVPVNAVDGSEVTSEIPDAGSADGIAELSRAVDGMDDAASVGADVMIDTKNMATDSGIADAIAQVEADKDETDWVEEQFQFINESINSIGRSNSTDSKIKIKTTELKAKIDLMRAKISDNNAKAAKGDAKVAASTAIENAKIKEKIKVITDKMAQLRGVAAPAADKTKTGKPAAQPNAKPVAKNAPQPLAEEDTNDGVVGKEQDLGGTEKAANAIDGGDKTPSVADSIEAALKDPAAEASRDDIVNEMLDCAYGQLIFMTEAIEDPKVKFKIAGCKNTLKMMKANFKKAKTDEEKAKWQTSIAKLSKKLSSLLGKKADPKVALTEAIEAIDLTVTNVNSIVDTSTDEQNAKAQGIESVDTDANGGHVELITSEVGKEMNADSISATEIPNTADNVDITNTVTEINEALELLFEGVSQLSDKKIITIKNRISKTKEEISEMRKQKKASTDVKKNEKLAVGIAKLKSKLDSLSAMLVDAFAARKGAKPISENDGDSITADNEVSIAIIDKVAAVADSGFVGDAGGKEPLSKDIDAFYNEPTEKRVDCILKVLPDDMSDPVTFNAKSDLATELVESSLRGVFSMFNEEDDKKENPFAKKDDKDKKDEEGKDDKKDKKENPFAKKDDNDKDQDGDKEEEDDEDESDDKEDDKNSDKKKDKDDESDEDDDEKKEKADKAKEDKKDDAAEKKALEESRKSKNGRSLTEEKDDDEDDDEDEEDGKKDCEKDKDEEEDDKDEEDDEEEPVSESLEDIDAETLLEAVIGSDEKGKPVKSPLKFLVRFLPESQLDKLLNVVKDVDGGKYSGKGKTKKEKVQMVRDLIDRSRNEKKAEKAEEKAKQELIKASKQAEADAAKDKSKDKKGLSEGYNSPMISGVLTEEPISMISGAVGLAALIGCAVACVPHIVSMFGDIASRTVKTIASTAGDIASGAKESFRKSKNGNDTSKEPNKNRGFSKASYANEGFDNNGNAFRVSLNEGATVISSTPVCLDEGYNSIVDLLALNENYFGTTGIKTITPDEKNMKLIQEMSILSARDNNDKRYERLTRAYYQVAMLTEAICKEYKEEGEAKAEALKKSKCKNCKDDPKKI